MVATSISPKISFFIHVCSVSISRLPLKVFILNVVLTISLSKLSRGAEDTGVLGFTKE